MRHTRLLVPVLALVVLVSAACGPTPAPAPAPAPSPEVAQSIDAAFGPFGPNVVAQATRVARCESGWVPTAGAGSYYQGLFQLGNHIQAIYVYGGDFLDPYQNAMAARDLYVSRGNNWSARACHP